MIKNCKQCYYLINIYGKTQFYNVTTKMAFDVYGRNVSYYVKADTSTVFRFCLSELS